MKMNIGSPDVLTDTVRIGVLGAGAWGTNLVRNVAACEEADLAVVCDSDEGARKRVLRRHRSTAVVADFGELLATPNLEGVIIATPPASHYEHARRALEAGYHVLVEKPICTTSADAASLCAIAERRGLTLMCGHTLLYSSAVEEMRRRIDAGELGDIRYVYCRRLNLGRVRPDVDALWNLAPHDIAVISHLLGAWPTSVNARGWSYLQPRHGIADVCFFQMEYPGGIAVSGHVSWLDPQKDRTLVVVGSDRMMVFDDMRPGQALQIFDKGVEVEFQSPMSSFAEYTTRVRSGDLVVPNVRQSEPLDEEIRHFARCIRSGARPLSDGWQGLRLVCVLEAMSKSMAERGQPIEVDYSAGQVHSADAAAVAAAPSSSIQEATCTPFPLPI